MRKAELFAFGLFVILALALTALSAKKSGAQVDVFGGDRIPYVGVAVSPTVSGRVAEVFWLRREGRECFIVLSEGNAGISCKF